MPAPTTLRVAVLACASVSVLFNAGCGKSTSVVKGTVTYQGKLVVIGSVMMLNEETMERVQQTITPDGTYEIAKAPHGVLRVTVYSSEPTKGPEQPTRVFPDEVKEKFKNRPSTQVIDPANWFPIPEKYGDFERSGLSVEVSSKETLYNIVLVD